MGRTSYGRTGNNSTRCMQARRSRAWSARPADRTVKSLDWGKAMMNRYHKLPAAVLAGLLSFMATGFSNAALSVEDLLASADGLITHDSDTGLDWLDVSATQGLSYENVVDGEGGWAALGFRHATATEVCALLSAHAVAPASGCPTGNVAVTDRFDSASYSRVVAFQALLGATYCASGCGAGSPSTDYVATEGWFDDELGNALAGRATLFHTTQPSQTSVGVRSAAAAESFASLQYGNWLVRESTPPVHARALAYVANFGSGTLSVIDSTTNAVTATIPVGNAPTDIVLTPDGDYAYVTLQSDHSVAVVDTATNTVIRTIAVGRSPEDIAISPDGTQVYVTNWQSGNVSVINTASNSVIGTVATGPQPRGVAIAPDGNVAWVTNFGSDSVTEIDTATLAASATFPAGDGAWKVAFSPDGGSAYVANFNAGTVSVVDTGTHAVTATVATGGGPWHLTVTPDSSWVYVARSNASSVALIDTATHQINATVGVGARPVGVKVTSDGARAYVTNFSSNSVSVIDASTRSVITTVPVGGGPAGIALFEPGMANSPPVADAGPDQSIRAGQRAVLDGSASYDDNTPSTSLSFAWNIVDRPAGSTASLTDPASAVSEFTADVAGNYVIELVVMDEQGARSAPDQIVVGSNNLAPAAVAGPDQLVVIGSQVALSGIASTDPENDPLSFHWVLTVAPEGSATALSGESTSTPSFFADVEGEYEVALTVSDAIGPGTPDSVVVVASTAENYSEFQVVAANTVLVALDPEQVTTSGNQTAFGNLLNQSVVAIQSGDIADAIDKLRSAVSRTDGCSLRNAPDGNGPGRDWITDCVEQVRLFTILNDAIDALTP